MADFRDFHLHSNARRRGIAASLAIHAGLLLLLFSIPAGRMIPAAKTIYISFGHEEKLSSEKPAGIKSEVRPKIAEARKAAKQEFIEKDRFRQRTETRVFLKDEPAEADGQKAAVTMSRQAGFSGSAKTAGTGGKKEGHESIVQTAFGTPDAPSFIRRETPVYPLLARRLGKEGKVVLKLAIDAKGSLQHIEVVEPSGFGFTEAAVEAVRKSSFAPARRMGNRIASKALLSIRFVLK